MINSEYGAFAYNWSTCGCEPKRFLIEIDFDYCMRKLTNDSHYIEDYKSYPQQVENRIIAALHDGRVTDDEAEDALRDLLDTEYDRGDLYFKELMEHELFDEIFGSSEYLPNAKIIDPNCVNFWEKVWLPFIEQLKVELDELN
ncbi:hypothetical protein [Photobacterium damselae]|uniref:hypothetical protein n=1 Tax=Photobacterium damselae TaxID=38293 RepID=UPI001F273004|nr:hypothetical protein [Photobacterium damselae]UKA04916.1 hypothetical protein IHC89_21980 [Photobacterium damselae subsp. damselae]